MDNPPKKIYIKYDHIQTLITIILVILIITMFIFIFNHLILPAIITIVILYITLSAANASTKGSTLTIDLSKGKVYIKRGHKIYGYLLNQVTFCRLGKNIIVKYPNGKLILPANENNLRRLKEIFRGELPLCQPTATSSQVKPELMQQSGRYGTEVVQEGTRVYGAEELSVEPFEEEEEGTKIYNKEETKDIEKNEQNM